jgi:hypothetical protein
MNQRRKQRDLGTKRSHLQHETNFSAQASMFSMCQCHQFQSVIVFWSVISQACLKHATYTRNCAAHIAIAHRIMSQAAFS